MNTTIETSETLHEIADWLRSGVPEVFDTMLGLPAEPCHAESLQSLGAPLICGSVGFTGKANGVTYIYTTPAFAQILASRMLGMPESELEGDEMVNDAFGEITNMVVGAVKSRLCDRGHTCVLTIPTVVRGNSFTIHPVQAAERCLVCFYCGKEQIYVETLLKSLP